jgi:hypothetical protein
MELARLYIPFPSKLFLLLLIKDPILQKNWSKFTQSFWYADCYSVEQTNTREELLYASLKSVILLNVNQMKVIANGELIQCNDKMRLTYFDPAGFDHQGQMLKNFFHP